jgi:uncharacterized membrane protein
MTEESKNTANTQTPLNNSAAPTSSPNLISPISAEDRAWAAFAYLPMISFVVLIVKHEIEFCLFHAQQALAIFVLIFLMIFLSVIFPSLGSLMIFVLLLISFFGAFKAYTGEKFAIPFISDFAKNLPTDSLIQGVTGKEKTDKNN